MISVSHHPYIDFTFRFAEKFFDMNKKNCKEALEIYKKFLERTDNVSAFLKVAEVSIEIRRNNPSRIDIDLANILMFSSSSF